MRKIVFAAICILTVPAMGIAKGKTRYNESIFYQAIENGDLKIVKEQIALGAPPNLVFGSIGAVPTPLVAALQAGQVEIMEYLVSKGADVNGKKSDTIPIYDASLSPLLMKPLLTRKLKVDAENSSGRTALMNAASHGCVECVELLLNAKADKNLKDRTGRKARDMIGEVSEKLKLHQLLD